MQLFVTGKLVDATDLPRVREDKTLDPLCVWTAGWYDGESLLAVNNAARFVAAVWPVQKEDLPEVLTSFPEIVRHALDYEQVNPAIIDRYVQELGSVQLVRKAGHPYTDRIHDMRDRFRNDYPNWLEPDVLQGMERSDVMGYHLNFVLTQQVRTDPEAKMAHPPLTLPEALSRRYGLPVYTYPVFRIDCTLDLIRYKAVRRIAVPADMPLDAFHRLLLKLYGWTGDHLHAFYAGRSRKSQICYMMPDKGPFDQEDLPEDEYRILDLYTAGRGNHAAWVYDFGDRWKVDLHLVKRLRGDPQEIPRLLSAEGAAPPENCGGAWSFAEMLGALKNPQDPEYSRARHWLGDDFQTRLSEEQSAERAL